MRCPKCQGLVVEDTFICEEGYWLSGGRCVNCGKVYLKENAINYTFKNKIGQVNKLDYLQLYRTRSRGIKRGSHSMQLGIG
jgi:hypothetical protein